MKQKNLLSGSKRRRRCSIGLIFMRMPETSDYRIDAGSAMIVRVSSQKKGPEANLPSLERRLFLQSVINPSFLRAVRRAP
jgi:hypothetical protein